MSDKFWKVLILVVFVLLFVSASVWMYKKYVIPYSKFNTELKLRGQK